MNLFLNYFGYLEPNLKIYGFDVSRYALKRTKKHNKSHSNPHNYAILEILSEFYQNGLYLCTAYSKAPNKAAVSNKQAGYLIQEESALNIYVKKC